MTYIKISSFNLPCKIEKSPKLYIAVSCHSNPQTGGKTTVDLYIYKILYICKYMYLYIFYDF